MALFAIETSKVELLFSSPGVLNPSILLLDSELSEYESEISIKGGGAPIMALGAVAAHGVTGLAGGVFICKERENSEGNEKFNEFSIGATHYPNAELGSVGAAPAGGGA